MQVTQSDDYKQPRDSFQLLDDKERLIALAALLALALIFDRLGAFT